MLLIFCVETKKPVMSDGSYIKALTNYFFKTETQEIVMRFVCMDGVGNYNKASMTNKIKKYIDHAAGDYAIIYVIDRDEYAINMHQQRLFNNITEYCHNSGYSCIIFARTIEEVLLNKTIADKDKTRSASNFEKSNAVENIDTAKLRHSTPTTNGTSNYLSVMESIIPEKYFK